MAMGKRRRDRQPTMMLTLGWDPYTRRTQMKFLIITKQSSPPATIQVTVTFVAP